MTLDYHLLDVFTSQRFGGNQLAVFPDPPLDLASATMQAIAKELNLSEVTFVFPPRDSANDFRVRIFTPVSELPMAGHPTVGTAYLLAADGQLGCLESARTIIFEEGVGPVPVRITLNDQGGLSQVWMRQPQPRFLDVYPDRQAIADMLSIAPGDLHDDAPCQVLSSGLPFLYVPVRSLEVIRALQLRLDRWQDLLMGSEAQNVFVTTTETIHAASSAHSRMFAPALGILEDAATGSASGPLGAYLLRYGLVAGGSMISEQGFEMGRPSLIHIRVGGDVEVGGDCVLMGRGTLLLDDASAAAG